MGKHTPGPWETTQDGRGAWYVTAGPWAPDAVTRARYCFLTGSVTSAEGSILFGPKGQTHLGTVGETEANARLMAAAPELFVALDEILAWCAGGDLPADLFDNGMRALRKALGEGR